MYEEAGNSAFDAASPDVINNEEQPANIASSKSADTGDNSVIMACFIFLIGTFCYIAIKFTREKSRM